SLRSCLVAWFKTSPYLTLNGSCTLCGGFAAFEEVPVMVTTYGPACAPACVDPPPPLQAPPPLQEIIPVPSAMRPAAESTCISRSERDDADVFGLKKAKMRPIVPKTANHKTIGEAGPIGRSKCSSWERAVVGTVTVNICRLPLRGK